MSIEWIDHAHFGTLNLSNCDREPIRIPGLIQSQGFMFIADPASKSIVSFSANVPILYDMPDWYDRELQLSDFFDVKELEQIENYCSAIAQVPSLECFATQVAGERYEITAINTDEHWFIEGLLATEAQDNHLEINNSVAAAITDFSLTSTVLEACEKAAKLVREMTSYDRVMVYQFDPKWNGVIIVENASDQLENRFRDMHFPHTDIPAQARQLYLENKTRVLMDVEAETIPMVPQTDPINDEPFDMKLTHLRAVSPVHIEYLHNMGVRATLVISIIVDDQLWGLIACHDYSGDRLVSIPIRRGCQCIADLLASTISRLSARDFNRGIDIANRIGEKIRITETAPGSIHQILKQYREDIRGLFDAQGIGWKIGEEVFSDGLTLSPAEIEKARKFSKDGVLIYDAFPEILGDDAESPDVGGVVLISVNNDCSSYLYLTRCIESKTVPWGGNPDTMLKVAADSNNDAVLTPRKSFDLWEESIRGRSIEFHMLHYQIANILRNVIIEANMEEQRLLSVQKIEQQLKRDRITGLPNRHALVENLNFMVEQNPESSFAVVLIDIDDFDQVVSSIGHDAAEQLIIQFASNLRGQVSDMPLAHTSMDQFAVVICPAPEPGALSESAEKLLAAVKGAYMVGSEVTHVTCCAAYSDYPNHGSTGERTLLSAEIALRHAKQMGAGHMLAYTSEMLQRAEIEKKLEGRLRAAFAEGHLKHHYQPIVDSRTGAIVGAEALMRWNDPATGVHYPREFIPSLLKMQLLGEIDEGLIESFLEHMSSLTKIRPDFFVSFNLAGQIFERSNSQLLEDLLNKMEPHAKNIAFEITESQVTEFPEESLISIQKMRTDGFQVLLDDFGTGHSSLAFLNDFPITGVKIDNRFIRDIEREKTEKLVESMQNIAFSLGLTTICEGVENRAQAVKLGVKGSYLHQGEHYFKPMPWEEFRKEVRAHRNK